MLKSGFSRIKEHTWDSLPPPALFLLAYALRFHFLTTYRHPIMVHEQDAIGYMEAAKSFLNLHLPDVAGRSPGYPAVIALFALLPVGLEYAARLASIFMDAMIIFPLYYIARIYLSRAGAAAVCLLWAFFSFSLYFSTSPLSQSSYLCYLLSGIALLHAGLKKIEWRYLFCSGIFMALSYLARPEGIVGFAYCFLFCLTILREDKKFSRRNLLMPCCFIAGFLLLAGPYLVALRVTFGGWTVSALTAVQVKSADAVLTLTADGGLHDTVATGLSAWRENYATLPVFFGAVYDNITAFARVYADAFPGWMTFFSALGFLLLAWRNSWSNTVLLTALLAVVAPVTVVNLPKTLSYLYPFFVMTFISFVFCFEVIVSGIGRFFGKLMPAGRRRFIELSVPAVLLVPVVVAAVMFYRNADSGYRSPWLVREELETENIIKGAGRVLQDISRTGDVVMTRWGLVGYFSGRPVLPLPKGGVKDVVEYGRKNGARFLLVDTKSVFTRREELEELLGPLKGKSVDPGYGLEEFYHAWFPDLGGYVIYRYRQP